MKLIYYAIIALFVFAADASGGVYSDFPFGEILIWMACIWIMQLLVVLATVPLAATFLMQHASKIIFKQKLSFKSALTATLMGVVAAIIYLLVSYLFRTIAFAGLFHQIIYN